MNATSVVVTAILIVLTGSVLLVGLAVGARRLLGLQLGVVRTVLAGVVGSATWLAFGLAIARPQQRPFMLTTVQLGIALLVAMGFLVLAEAVLPSGSVRPLAWARALRQRLARVRRYLQVSRIAARHGLLPYLRGRRCLQADTPAGRAGLARSVRLALEDGGVSFVPDDPSQPGFTGHLAEWFGQNVNARTSTITNAENVVLHGSDGSLGKQHILLHLTVNANGTVTSFIDIDEFTC